MQKDTYLVNAFPVLSFISVYSRKLSTPYIMHCLLNVSETNTILSIGFSLYSYFYSKISDCVTRIGGTFSCMMV